jgi:hypothetical protein
VEHNTTGEFRREEVSQTVIPNAGICTMQLLREQLAVHQSQKQYVIGSLNLLHSTIIGSKYTVTYNDDNP